MKIVPTPNGQKDHNDDIHRRLKVVAALGATLMLAALGLEASLYFSSPTSAVGPTIVGADGSIICSALPLTPELVITNTDPPSGSQLLIAGSGRLTLQRVRAESIRGATLVLSHLDGTYPKEIRQIRAADSGESASAASVSGKWMGTLVGSPVKNVFDAQPELTLGDMSAIVADNDKALLGIAVPSNKGDVVISAQELLGKFPELRK